MNKKITSLLSLCMKAGKIVAGEFISEKVIQDSTAKLVILASDASENTKKKFINKCDFYKIPYLMYGTGEDIGLAIGKRYRMVVAITEEGFANKLNELIKLENSSSEVNMK